MDARYPAENSSEFYLALIIRRGFSLSIDFFFFIIPFVLSNSTTFEQVARLETLLDNREESQTHRE